MKKLLIFILLSFILIGCGKANIQDVSVESIIDDIKQNYPIKDAIVENLKDQSIAQIYGISPLDIEQGLVYKTTDPNLPDKVLVIKAKAKDNMESIERAISSEIVRMGDAWKDFEEQAQKVDNHIFKTKDTYVIYCVSDYPENIVEIFDSKIDKK